MVFPKLALLVYACAVASGQHKVLEELTLPCRFWHVQWHAFESQVFTSSGLQAGMSMQKHALNMRLSPFSAFVGQKRSWVGFFSMNVLQLPRMKSQPAPLPHSRSAAWLQAAGVGLQSGILLGTLQSAKKVLLPATTAVLQMDWLTFCIPQA